LYAIVIIGRVIASAAVDSHSAENHFYNLEYDQAIADYTILSKQYPNDPIRFSDLASAILYKILYHQGLLDSHIFGKDNEFLKARRPPPNAEAIAEVLEILDRGRGMAEALLLVDRHNKLALFALCTNYGLRATYDFALEKSWFSALRNGSKSHAYCEQVLRVDPTFVDAYLVLGLYEYAAGSLPLPVRIVAAMGGLGGSKEKAFRDISQVAQYGNYNRTAARVLLSVLYRRERRPLDAARVLGELIADYPRNYLFVLELAEMYADADQPEVSLGILKNLLQKGEQNAPGYGELPRKAIQQKMRSLRPGLF
jgi:tetratricopeptide (TPR) repeat protein